MVQTFGTGVVPDERIEEAVRKVFDLTPRGIIKALNLRQPIYLPTAAYGHFGRKPFSRGGRQFFPWELTDKARDLLHAVG
jgi:S-adenosylmethionine synthetase